MTRKDYQLIADVLRERGTQADKSDAPWMKGFRSAHVALARDFADALAADNPRFDRTRFFKACGVLHDPSA